MTRSSLVVAALVGLALVGPGSAGCGGERTPAGEAEPANSDMASSDMANEVPSTPALSTRIGVPGTGVSLDVPPGFELASVGPLYVSTDAQTQLLVVITSAEREPADDTAARFPRLLDREVPLAGGLRGQVRWRTRRHDGGVFDGWNLRAERAGRVLSVSALYTGASEAEFRSLLGVLGSVEWLPGREDNRAAMGIEFPPVAGLYPQADAIGALAFAEHPALHEDDAQLFVSVPGYRVDAPTFRDGCAGLLGDATTPSEDIRPLRTDAFTGCEGHAASPRAGHTQYRAALRAPDGSLLVAVGDVDSRRYAEWAGRFTDVVRALSLTR